MAENLGPGTALILGVSSGFGAATAIEMARAGLDVVGVHLDRRATLPIAEAVASEVRALGREALFFNVNAADPEKRAEILAQLKARATDGKAPVRVLLHSLAFGALKTFCAPDSKDRVTPPQLEMTLDVMASSVVYWTQDLVAMGLLGSGSRVYAMTSEGSTVAWGSYGPVSAAKAALESYCRQLAVELAPQGITVNAIRAGVTDTPALRKIPGGAEMLASAARRNPNRRLTQPEDVARCLVALARPETQWLTGNVLGVDGGEGVSGG